MKIRSVPATLLCTALTLCGTLTAQFKPEVPANTIQRPQQSSVPAVNSVSPTEATVGGTVTITFNGTNFVNRAMSLTFEPSVGIRVNNLSYVSPQEIKASLSISASAMAGPRQINLMDGHRNLQVADPLTLTQPAQGQNCGTAAFAPANCGTSTEVPALRGFMPYQGTQGSTVTVTVTGANFTSPATALSVEKSPDGTHVSVTVITPPSSKSLNPGLGIQAVNDIN